MACVKVEFIIKVTTDAPVEVLNAQTEETPVSWTDATVARTETPVVELPDTDSPVDTISMSELDSA